MKDFAFLFIIKTQCISKVFDHICLLTSGVNANILAGEIHYLVALTKYFWNCDGFY